MKIVPSITRTQQRQIEALERLVEEQKARIHELERLVKQKGLNHIKAHCRRDSVTSTLDSRDPIESRLNCKSFLQPTATSRRHSVVLQIPEPEPCLPGRKASSIISPSTSFPSPLYHDGRLLEETDFMKATQSSRSKRKCLDRPRYESDCDNHPGDADEPEDIWDQPDVGTTSNDTSQATEPSLICTTCEKIEWTFYHPTSTSLELRSRLHRTDTDPFYKTTNPASLMFVPNRLISRLLRLALRYTQETIWSFFRQHWPEEQRRRYPEGPEEVKLGREEVEHAFGTWSNPPSGKEDDCVAACGKGRRSVYGSIEAMAPLRNAVAHPGWHSPRQVDSLLHTAQALAVTVNDESRALKIRALRDELQSGLLKSYNEILLLGPLATLPGARSWAIHHQQLFQCIISTAYSGNREYPAPIIQAAQEWGAKNCRPGEMDRSFVDRIERAKECVRMPTKAERANVQRFQTLYDVLPCNVYLETYQLSQKFMQTIPSHGRRASVPGAMPGVPGLVAEPNNKSGPLNEVGEEMVKEVEKQSIDTVVTRWPVIVQEEVQVDW